MSSFVRRVASAQLPTAYGNFLMHVYKDAAGKEYAVLVAGDVTKGDVLVRLHSSCLTGDVFHSRRCDCRPQLERALGRTAREGKGIIIYLPQEGRGIGLTNKIRAYALQQEKGLDTVDANTSLGLSVDDREYGDAAAILHDLGVERVRLLTNNPLKATGLESAGVTVISQVSVETSPTKYNRRYLRTKKKRMGHRLRRV